MQQSIRTNLSPKDYKLHVYSMHFWTWPLLTSQAWDVTNLPTLSGYLLCMYHISLLGLCNLLPLSCMGFRCLNKCMFWTTIRPKMNWRDIIKSVARVSSTSVCCPYLISPCSRDDAHLPNTMQIHWEQRTQHKAKGKLLQSTKLVTFLTLLASVSMLV